MVRTMDALHAEALEMDAEETAKVEGVTLKAVFRPRPDAPGGRDPKQEVTVTNIVGRDGDIWVCFNIWEPGFRGRPGNWASGLILDSFLRLYEPLG